MDFTALEGNRVLRSKVLTRMCLMIGALALMLSISDIFLLSNYTCAGLELSYFLFSVYVYQRVQRGKFSNLYLYLYVFIFSFLIVAGSVLKLLSSGVFVWSLCLPVILYLALGRQWGSICTLCLFLVQLAIIAFKLEELNFNPTTMLLNFSFSYLSIWTVAHTYESTRESGQRSLKNLALRDMLTGAKNRLAFKREFSSDHTKNRHKYLLAIDVDHFKNINDSFGHNVGDDVLIQLVDRFSSIVGGENVYRHGGEEFCVTLNQSSQQEVLDIAEQLRLIIATKPCICYGHPIKVTISIGVTELSPDDSIDQVLKTADKNLYLAKSGGRNQVVYNFSSVTVDPDLVTVSTPM
ncbi:GGDEF domain-containing protein [Vibrio sp. T187]|uniref:GGDEF domain-containing protein n=1 Tax=Vibrio TaxID=662 RepID=UPI0010C991AF|nr:MULTISPECIES: GGDEF domain-containing protein [Vibrio]MBW3695648.1 GGDEF domain-containing protein [Vibrio sp. T187]